MERDTGIGRERNKMLRRPDLGDEDWKMRDTNTHYKIALPLRALSSI